MHHLHAGAVWVTISNWADALAARFGAAEIVTSSGVLSAATVRSQAWSPTAANSPAASTGRRMKPLEAHARTLAKDVRWAMRSIYAETKVRMTDLERYSSSPFVWQHHDLFAHEGFVAASRLTLPLVLFVDAPQVWEARQWGVSRPGWGDFLVAAGERPQFERADIVACVTDEVADQVKAITRNRARTIVTPCTANVPVASGRAENRSRLGLEGRLVVGWVGSFRRFHHVDALIRASAKAATFIPNLTLLLIGDGPTRAECALLAAELGLDCRLPGSVPNDEVIGLLQACDVGVIPSGSVGSFHYSPLKLKEYLAAGIPTLVPRVGEMARTLQSDVETLFYAPGDLDELQQQLRRLGTDQGLRQSLASAGQQVLLKQFSINDQITTILNSLQGFRIGDAK